MGIWNGVNVSIISNITLEPYMASSAKAAFGKYTKVSLIPFDEFMENSNKSMFAATNLITVWLNLENMLDSLMVESNKKRADYIVGRCTELFGKIQAISYAKIIWFSFENYEENLSAVAGRAYNSFADEINIMLHNALEDQVTFIDFQYLIAEVGISNAYSVQGKYRWDAPYSSALMKVALQEICKQYYIDRGITKKCLVLDCDGVLWGGALVDDGIENIKLGRMGRGRAFRDFQKFVLYLYQCGVILAICSKNDLNDVISVFCEHDEMILKKEYISCFQVNWEEKPKNIIEISEKINISFDSMVFVDDSLMEIEAVKKAIPDITAILYRSDMEYSQFDCFNLKNGRSIEEIEKRTETYKANQLRKDLAEAHQNYEDFMKELAIQIEMHEIKPMEIGRFSELSQRTNKCTNGKRYSVAELKERLYSHRAKMYSVYISDRFSDMGLVGGIEIEDDTLCFFALSCRALGYGIEEKMMEKVKEKHNIKSIEFKDTGKNGILKERLVRCFGCNI